MRNNRFIAWLLVVSVFLSMFSTSLTVSYADVIKSVPQVHTNMEEEDTESPIIVVEGLVNNEEVTEREFGFKVTVTDHVYHDITPEVRLNGVVISASNEEYKVSLDAGDNIVIITAIDGAGNKAEETLVVHYKEVFNKVRSTDVIKEQLDKNLTFLVQTVDNPTFGTISGEWSILSLARANYPVPSNYYETYYSNVVNKVIELSSNKNNNGHLDKNKSTEHSRVILGLGSIGKDISDVGGYDLKKSLADFNYLLRQGINGPIFALIGLDSKNYEVPQVQGVTVQTTREMLIQYILNAEIKKGTDAAAGWALGSGGPDPDITAMALQGLTPYYTTNTDVGAAVDRAITWLSQAQKDDGSYASTGNFAGLGSSNTESTAQVVVALTGLGIDPHTDSRFIKNGKSAIDALLTFALPEGGFKHIASGQVDGMATDQGTYALVAYDRFVDGKNRLYDMTDEVPEVPEVPESPKEIEVTLPSGDQPEVVIPEDELDYIIPIHLEDSNKEITLEIPADKNSTVSVNLPVNSSLPELKATKGNVSLVIPKGSQVTSGDASALELMTSKDKTDAALINKVNGIVPEGEKLDNIIQAFSMGGNTRIEFSQFITLTFAGMSGKEAAYIQGGSIHAIHKYAGDSEGLNSSNNEYAYDSGNDLIVKTNHFTDFIAYTSSVIETPGGDGDGGNTGGGTVPVPQPKQYVTLSVDKLTINKDYVVTPTSVEIQSGDTAWTVLKRMLDSRSISYDYIWTEKYGSVYVESIAGDGEFDHGSGSGWMYNVNGWYPNYGASKYTLSDGDTLQWRYTTDLGADLGEDLSKYEKTPDGSISMGQGIVIHPDDKTPVINVPKDIQKDYTLNIAKELKNTINITINIPDVTSKVFLTLKDVISNIPMITVTKGDISLVIEKGTQLKSGNTNIELITTMAPNDTKIQELIKDGLSSNDKFVEINQAFIMGNTASSVVFDKPLTLTFKGGKGQHLGFIESNKFTPIKIYETEQIGLQETKGNDKKTYAFVNGNDLIVKTNHFTTFVSYTVGKADVTTKVDSVNNVDLKKMYTDADAISSWAYKAIGEATKNGFIQGNNGKFNPKSNITRAEFTKVLVTVLGLNIQTDKVINFKDVAADDWFYPYVNAAYKAGFITGFNDEFSPNDTITREQMAATIIRALGIQPTKLTTVMKDSDKVSAWARTDVETIVALELMLGSDGQFKPKDSVTREMAAVIATRAYDYKNRNKVTVENDVKVENVSKVENKEVKKTIQETAVFLQKAITDPVIASVGGDWTVFGLARSEVYVPDAYYAKYYANVEKILKEKSGKLHSVKYTEYDRVILALTSMGKGIDNVAGYNLREPLADFDTLIKQGINGPIFALIALDSNHYEIPIDKGVKTQTTREMLIDFIVKREISGGGWALGNNASQPDPDITGMAIQGLTPYYSTNPNVKAAVDRGVVWLSKAQKADGGYASWESANSESVAQVIVALTSLGIDPHNDARFIKNGKSPMDALLSFAAVDGGFYHIKQGGTDNGGAKPGEVDLMATDQAMYALVAYDRFIKGHTRLYDMTDVK